MKIEYKAEKEDILGFLHTFYKPVKPIEPCCDEIEEAMGDNLIGFSSHSEYNPEDNNFNIYSCIPYHEGAAYDSTPIKFCPFCGEEIICKQVD
jgi:hypothetical protein